MSLLIVNSGTSSVKMTLFGVDDHHPKRLIEGLLKDLFSTHPTLEINGKNIPLTSPLSYVTAIEKIVDHFKQAGFSPSSLKGIGHRVVHGGEKYTQTTLLIPKVVKELEALSELAPLHNPPAMSGIACTQHLFPHVPHIAVFDTAFHTTLPPKAAFYPIPWEFSQKYKIKRYGFHGIAHAFSWKKYRETHGKEVEKSKVITLHLGSGCSLAAIHSGVSLDTTMGFTPLDGLMMATRSGELDPAVVSFLYNKESKTPDEIIDILNHRSGFLGISGTATMQKLIEQAPVDAQAKLALEMFIYHIQKKVGAFMAVLEGVDALLFSGGIGENGWEVRQKIVEALKWCSVVIDAQKNQLCTHIPPGKIECISQTSSKVSLYVVGCDENLFIAEEMLNLTPV